MRVQNGVYKETLTLHSDGSFEFDSYKKFDGMHPPESHSYGKGSWEVKKNSVYFSTKKTDLDKKYTLDWSNTQARFNTKSPRDKSNRNIPTTLRIFKSEIKWLVGRTLVKQ